jgi:hypothetical protein
MLWTLSGEETRWDEVSSFWNGTVDLGPDDGKEVRQSTGF